MNPTPINLNKVRKAKARAEAETRAQENRVKFGRSKAEKQALGLTADRNARNIDGHKRER